MRPRLGKHWKKEEILQTLYKACIKPNVPILLLVTLAAGCSGSEVSSTSGFSISAISSNTRSWSEDNGSGTWGKFHIHGLSKPELVSVVNAGGSHPVRAGAQSIRIERRAGGCVGQDCVNQSERTEITPEGLERNGDSTWYAWSIYHKDYVWLQNGVSPWEGQFKALSGPMVMQFVMDEHRGMDVTFDHFEGWRPRSVISKSQINNRWHDILVHAKWSSGADGLIRVWVNGHLKVERRGKNFSGDSLLFRFGIYAPQINRAGSRPTQVVYFDEIMRGPTCQSVSQFMACPAG